MYDTEKLTSENTYSNTDDLSLESILAEYADFDVDKAAERDTAERSKQIVYESLGETEFSGGLTSADAEGTQDDYGYPVTEPVDQPQDTDSYYRAASQYTNRLRRGFERFGRSVNVPAEDEYTPEPAHEPEFASDDDVKVYRPASAFTMPEGDEDVKVYGAGSGEGLGSVIAEAERRSAKWKKRGIFRSRDADVRDYSPHHSAPYHSYDAREENTYSDADTLDYHEPEVIDYAPQGGEAEGYAYEHGGYADADARDYAADYADTYADSGWQPDYDTDAFSDTEGHDSGFDDDDDVRSYDIGGEEEHYASPDSENGPVPRKNRARMPGPVLGFLATLGVKLKNAQTAGEAVSIEDAEELGEEMPPKKAAKYYAGNVNSLRIRFRLSLLPALALLWVSLGLPAFGALGSDLKVTSLACLVMQLAVVMLGLDVFTAGIMSLVRGKPGMWSLVAVANIAAALDAAIAYAVGEAGWGFPMCAAATVSMVFAIGGSLLEARALRFSCKAQELAEDPVTVTAESGIEGRDGTLLIKSRRGTSGWLHRCEEPDETENVYSTAGPWLLLASIVLALIATVATKRWTYFFRILAACTCAAAPAGMFIACPLPYFLLALRSFRRGAAVAGWPGMRDIGRSLGMVITDSDLFPSGSVKIDSIRVLATSQPEKIIADAASVIIASGGGLSGIFSDLLARNGYAMRRVENFCCHEGGGLTALIAGEEVLCGSVAFMRLMGIMVPQKLAGKTSVFVAINGELSGIFNIEYTPVPSVGKGLRGCLRHRRAPVFAVRDFLVTPLMLSKKFGVPAEGFDFPLFSARYAISSIQPDEGSPICALLGREGLGAYMEIAGCGRRCFLSAELGTMLSAVGSVVGVLLAFALYTFGGGLTVGWTLALMCLWTLPSVIVSIASAR